MQSGLNPLIQYSNTPSLRNYLIMTTTKGLSILSVYRP